MTTDRKDTGARDALTASRSPAPEPPVPQTLDRRHSATSDRSSRPAKPRRAAIQRRLLPQTRPTPTPREARAVTYFLRARLRETCSTGSCPGCCLASRILAAEGLLRRYRRAVSYAACPPNGLGHAWELVAATLASEVADLATTWSTHPDFDPKWIR